MHTAILLSGAPDYSIRHVHGCSIKKTVIKTEKLSSFLASTDMAIMTLWAPNQEVPFTNNEVVRRAARMTDEKWGTYCTVTKNCHHFVTWARYGRKFFFQTFYGTSTNDGWSALQGSWLQPLAPLNAFVGWTADATRHCRTRE
eukprot:jgi/Mesvir1/3273/Mv16405-RA.1